MNADKIIKISKSTNKNSFNKRQNYKDSKGTKTPKIKLANSDF